MEDTETILELIDKIIGYADNQPLILNHLTLLRSRAETLEQSERSAELPPQDKSLAAQNEILAAENKSLRTSLEEARQEIEHLQTAARQESNAAKNEEKIALVREAVAQGRPVCHCSPTGEVMLFGNFGVYRCPKCSRMKNPDGSTPK